MKKNLVFAMLFIAAVLTISFAVADISPKDISSKVFSKSLKQETVSKQGLRGGNATGNQSCTDSDGGANYNVQGTVNGLELPGVWDTWYDYCGVAGNEAGKLVEYICTPNDYGQKVLYSCPNGCSNGACIQGNQTGNQTAPSCNGVSGNINGTNFTYWEKKDGANYHEFILISSCTGQEYFLDFHIRYDSINQWNEVDVINEVTGQTIAIDKIVGDIVTIGDTSFTILNILNNATDKYVILSAGPCTTFTEFCRQGTYTCDGSVINVEETQPIQVDNYWTSINFIDSNSARLDFNGELTNDLIVGQSDQLIDGTTINMLGVNYLQNGTLGNVDFSCLPGNVTGNQTHTHLSDYYIVSEEFEITPNKTSQALNNLGNIITINQLGLYKLYKPYGPNGITVKSFQAGVQCNAGDKAIGGFYSLYGNQMEIAQYNTVFEGTIGPSYNVKILEPFFDGDSNNIDDQGVFEINLEVQCAKIEPTLHTFGQDT